MERTRFRKRYCTVALLCLLAWPCGGSAQQWKTYTTSDSLAHNTVNAVAQDSLTGAMWFATDNGVSRFDGTWRNFTSENTGGKLGDNRVMSVFQAADGAIWFGTFGGGASRYDERTGVWETYTRATTTRGLADGSVRSLLRASDGSMWVGTREGLTRYERRGGAWEFAEIFTEQSTNGMLVPPVISISEADGAIWFGLERSFSREESGGVSRFDGVSWQRFEKELSGASVEAMFQDAGGAIWFGTGGGLVRYDRRRDEWLKYRSDGLSRFNRGTGEFDQLIESYPSGSGPPDGTVKSIHEGRDGAIWFAGYGGLSRFDGRIWETFTQENTSRVIEQAVPGLAPGSIAGDGSGNLYLTDNNTGQVLKIAPDATVSVVAGSGTRSRYDAQGDGVPATRAQLNSPSDVLVDANGDLYIADAGNGRVRRVDAVTGEISTVAGTGDQWDDPQDGVQATASGLRWPVGVALDGSGNLYIADSSDDRVRRVDASGGIATVAGTGEEGYSGDGGPATAAQLNAPQGVFVDGAGNLYIADTGNHRVRMVKAGSDTVVTVAGNSIPTHLGDGPRLATEASLRSPEGVFVDGEGNLYIADTGNERVRKVDAAGMMTTVAGSGDPDEYNEDPGDGVPATEAVLNAPARVFVDGAGNLFISENYGHRVRRVGAENGLIQTVAGGVRDYDDPLGDGGPATEARLNYPRGIFVDGSGALYIADSDNGRVRKVEGDLITTVAGRGVEISVFETVGDGRPAREAVLDAVDVFVADSGNLYIADRNNAMVRMVDAGTGVIATVAGNGENGFSGDGGPATEARLSSPQDVFVDGKGNLYIADAGSHLVRMVEAGSGVIRTVAGDTSFAGRGGGFSPDGPATKTRLNGPAGLFVDASGNIYIADTENGLVRRVDAQTGMVKTVAGTRGGGSDVFEAGLQATEATLSSPRDVFLDGAVDLYIAAAGSGRVLRVDLETGEIVALAGTGDRWDDPEDGVQATESALRWPVGIALDNSGDLYIADEEANRVRRVDMESGLIETVVRREFKEEVREPGLAGSSVHAVFQGRGDTLWVGTSSGLNLFDGEAWRFVGFERGDDGQPWTYDVSSIVRGDDGAIWLGSYGVLRYDPLADEWQRFMVSGVERFDPEAKRWLRAGSSYGYGDGLASDDIRAIVPSGDGAVLFGTGNGLSLYEPAIERWQTFREADGLADERVLSIAQDREGRIWFGGVSRQMRYDREQDRWRAFSSGDSIKAMVRLPDGTVLFGTDRGIAWFNSSGEYLMDPFRQSDGLAGDSVSDMLLAEDGTLWVATDGGVSRVRLTGDREQPIASAISFTVEDGLASNRVRSVAQDRDGSIWFGTEGQGAVGGGVSRFDGEAWELFTRETTQDGLAGNRVLAVFRDRDGAIWFGTDSGVSRFASWRKFTLENTAGGLADNSVRALYLASDGTVWFGTGRGASRFDGAVWQTYTRETSFGLLGANAIRSIYEDRDGTIWFGTEGGDASRFDGQIWERFTEVSGSTVWSIAQSDDGAVWFGTDSGVSRYDGTRWEYHSSDDGLPDRLVRAAIQARDGAMWFGTAGGASRFDWATNRWWIYTRARTAQAPGGGLVNDDVWAVYEDRQGDLWFGTSGGVSRFDGERWTTFTTLDGLAGDRVFAILQDRTDVMWFGTENGLVRFDERNENWETYTNADGLAGNLVRAVLQDDTGRMWVGAEGGANFFLRPENPLVQTQILSIVPAVLGVNRIFIQCRGFEIGSDAQPPLSFAVTRAEERPAAWSPFLFVNGFELTEAELTENGTWTFHVRARDRNGNIDPAPETRTFRVDLTAPTVVISGPRSGDAVSGEVRIEGSAFDRSAPPDLVAFDLHYAPGTDADEVAEDAWVRIAGPVASPVENSVLGTWNTQALADGAYLLRVQAEDSLKHRSEHAVSVQVVSALERVGGDEGGRVTANKGSVELMIPPGGLKEPVDVQMALVPAHAQAPPPGGVGETGLVYRIGPPGLAFEKRSTLTIGYEGANFAGEETNLAVFVLLSNTWERLGGTVDTGAQKISVGIRAAGTYGLFEADGTGGSPGVGDVACQPRIISPGGGRYPPVTDISFSLGTSAEVDVRVYSVSGNLIREVEKGRPLIAGLNTVQWDGRDRNGRAVKSGIYIVVIAAGGKAANKTVAVLNR